MSQTDPSKLTLLRDLPRKNLSPEQQLEAIRKVQAQAEQRVKLGMQLFKAAEARITAQQDLVDQFRRDQNELRDQVQQDVARTLQEYDQWIGRIDESFTRAMQRLEERLDAIEQAAAESDERVQGMVSRAEDLMDQTRYLLEKAKRPAAHTAPPAQAESSGVPLAPHDHARSAPDPAQAKPTPPPSAATEPVASEAIEPEPSQPLPPEHEGADEESAPTSHTEQEKVYSRLLDQLRRCAENGPNSEAA